MISGRSGHPVPHHKELSRLWTVISQIVIALQSRASVIVK